MRYYQDICKKKTIIKRSFYNKEYCMFGRRQIVVLINTRIWDLCLSVYIKQLNVYLSVNKIAILSYSHQYYAGHGRFVITSGSRRINTTRQDIEYTVLTPYSCGTCLQVSRALRMNTLELVVCQRYLNPTYSIITMILDDH